ncbi:MAG: diacylglycerol kinase family protein [Rhodanobacter sp.]
MNIHADSKVAVLINGSAGGGHDDNGLAEIDAQLRAAGCTAEAVLVSAQEITSAVEKAVHEGVGTLVVGGGDGTLGLVASILAGTDIILGILPMGSLNHFAKDLGIPPDLPGAVRTALQGCVAHVDIGEVNGRVFINNSSIGIYPDIVRLRERQRQRFGTGKWLAFAAATWAVLRRGARLKLRIAGADRELTRRTPFVFVGNNEYRHAGFDFGSRSSLQGGVLGVYTTRKQGLLGILRITLKGITGRLDQGADYDALSATEVVIETHRHRVRVANDGEVEWMTSPLRYRSRVAALQVMVPRSFHMKDG